MKKITFVFLAIFVVLIMLFVFFAFSSPDFIVPLLNVFFPSSVPKDLKLEEIQGVVTDAMTNKPIPNIGIYIGTFGLRQAQGEWGKISYLSQIIDYDNVITNEEGFYYYKRKISKGWLGAALFNVKSYENRLQTANIEVGQNGFYSSHEMLHLYEEPFGGKENFDEKSVTYNVKLVPKLENINDCDKISESLIKQECYNFNASLKR